jgi:hypothetical protein
MCRFVLTSILGSLTACGPATPDVDETTFLEEIEFNEPIAISAAITGPFDDRGGLATGHDAHSMALFAKAGYVTLTPNPERAPWWNVSVNEGDLQRQRLSVFAAKRVVSGRSKEESWSEGKTDYYAQTIAYRFELEPRIRALLSPKTYQGTYSLRLVIKHDPALGRWVLAERGNDFNKRDQSALVNEIEAVGTDLMGYYAQTARAAQTAAFDAIEKNLANSGALARSSTDPFVLVSKNANLAYYTKPTTISADTTVGQLKNYCAALDAGGFSNWRIPQFPELAAAFVQTPSYYRGGIDYSFRDTPDGRLWGGMSQHKNPPYNIAYLSSTAVPDLNNTRTKWSLYDIPDAASSFGVEMMTFRQGYYLGWNVLDLYRRGTQTDDVPLHTVNPDEHLDRRVICVASLDKS